MIKLHLTSKGIENTSELSACQYKSGFVIR